MAITFRIYICVAFALASASLFRPAYAETHQRPVTDANKYDTVAPATRTVEIAIRDNYYTPERVSVKVGETVRFVVANTGNLVHGFFIGNPATHPANATYMQMMVEHGVLKAASIDRAAAAAMQVTMGHGVTSESSGVLLEPGTSGEVVWTFAESGELEFACNVPGHYDAGMLGIVEM